MGEEDKYQKVILNSFSYAYPTKEHLIELASLLDDESSFERLMNLPINDNFRIAGLILWLNGGKDIGEIVKVLNKMGPRGSFNFFKTCILLGKTGKRVKKTLVEYLKGKDEKFVILNRKKINYLLRKLHIKRDSWNSDMMDFIFKKKAKKGSLYQKYLQAKNKPQPGLPFSVAIGFVHMYGPKARAEFMKEAVDSITPNEAAKYFKMFKRYGVSIEKKLKKADPLRIYKLYRLRQVPLDTYLKSVENFSKRIKIPKELSDLVVVFDNSKSIRRTNDARFNDILLVFADLMSKHVPVYLGSGEEYKPENRKPKYRTMLVPGLAKAVDKGKTILLATDGYENFPALLTDRIMHAYANSGDYFFAQVTNSKAIPISGIPTIGIRNTNQINHVLECLAEVVRH